MKVQHGVVYTATSGKAGGTVASTGMAGPNIKTRPRGTKPKTNSQAGIKSLFSQINRGWRSLTQVQIAAWNAFAKTVPYKDVFGNTRVLSGKSMYCKLNMSLETSGNAGISNPVAFANTIGINSISAATNTSAAQSLAFAASPTPAGTTTVIMATPPLSAGVSRPGKSKYRVIAYLAAATATAYNSFAAYSAVNGTPVTGKKIFWLAYTITNATGQVSIAVGTSSVTA